MLRLCVCMCAAHPLAKINKVLYMNLISSFLMLYMNFILLTFVYIGTYKAVFFFPYSQAVLRVNDNKGKAEHAQLLVSIQQKIVGSPVLVYYFRLLRKLPHPFAFPSVTLLLVSFFFFSNFIFCFLLCFLNLFFFSRSRSCPH